MAAATELQIKKIWTVSRQKGLDKETLYSYINSLVGKSSVKELTKRDAMTVIDNLVGKTSNAPDMISDKQMRYIEGLAREYGWVNEDGTIDRKRLFKWLENRFNTSHIDWLSSKQASKAIEGLKAMQARKRETAAKVKEDAAQISLQYAT